MFEGLRLRLTLWYTGIFGLVLVILGMVLTGVTRRSLYEGVEGGAQIAATEVIKSLRYEHQHLTIPPADFDDLAHDLSTYQAVSAVEILDRDGHLVIWRGLRLAPPSDPRPGNQQLSVGNASFWIHTQAVIRHGRRVGYVRIVRPLSDLERTLRRFTMALGILIPASLLISLLAGVVMAGKVMKPIQEAFDRLRRFTADASHELRTPLAIIQTQADVLSLTDPSQLSDLPKLLDPIKRAGRRMSDLVADLLFLARSDSSSLELQRVRLSFDELVEETVEEYRPLAIAKGLRLEYEGAPVEIQGDPQRLHQLLTNLLGNAIKYTDAGFIKVSLESHGGTASLKVSDSGSGIDAMHLPHVFERFYRSDAARSAEKPGTGLGLAIAKAIVKAHRGDIQVQSRLGQGSQFTVILPYQA